MSSLKRILSSRANGARSRGPTTPAGRQASSLNAIRHGLLAKRAVLATESRAGFDARLYDDAIATRQPGDEIGRLAASPQFGLLHRHEARLHHMRQRALENIYLFRNTPPPNQPAFDPPSPGSAAAHTQADLAILRLLPPGRSAGTGPLRTGCRRRPRQDPPGISRNCRQNGNPREIRPGPP